MEVELNFDTFEQFFETEKPVAEKPSIGPHRFKVVESKFDELYVKWSFVLENKEGQQIKKTCHLTNPEKKQANTVWIECLFASRPTGRPADFDWSACKGRYVDAEVAKFTPEDKDTEVTYVYRPVRVDPPAGQATVKRETRDQKAKSAMSKEMLNDVPF
jgi:hypothetical protein